MLLTDITPALILGFLDHLESERHNAVRSRNARLAVIGQPGLGWVGQRDCLLLALMYDTCARVSEVIGVKVSDVVLNAAACVHLHGKGRKERSVPLRRSTVKAIRAWLRLNADLGPTSALLPNRGGDAMKRSNVTQRLALASGHQRDRLVVGSRESDDSASIRRSGPGDEGAGLGPVAGPRDAGPPLQGDGLAVGVP
jgi:integrase